MTLETVSRGDFAIDLGILTGDGTIIERRIAELLRAPLFRWGLSPKRAVLRYAREQIDAAGLSGDIPNDAVNAVLSRMIAFGECQEVSFGHEQYIAPSSPRWLSTGRDTGALLGVHPFPNGVQAIDSPRPADITRRFHIRPEDDLTAFHLAGVTRTSIEEWLQPIGYLRHGARRMGRPLRDDALSLAEFWNLLDKALAEEGHPISSDAEIRVLTGEGPYFGRYSSPQCEGRWSEESPDGVWCAYRRGYADTHWHPILLAVDGEDRRCLDLFNADEWRWALLARGRATGRDEVIQQVDGCLTLTFPPPSQLMVGMDILGQRDSVWTWTMSLDAPDIWSLLR